MTSGNREAPLGRAGVGEIWPEVAVRTGSGHRSGRTATSPGGPPARPDEPGPGGVPLLTANRGGLLALGQPGDPGRRMKDFSDLTPALTFTKEGWWAVVTIDRKKRKGVPGKKGWFPGPLGLVLRALLMVKDKRALPPGGRKRSATDRREL